MFLNLKPKPFVLVSPCRPQLVSKESTMPSNKKTCYHEF